MGAPGTDAWQRELLKSYERHRRQRRAARMRRAGWWFAFLSLALGAATIVQHSIDQARVDVDRDIQRSLERAVAP